MFVSRHAHDLIVAELRTRITELEKERDYYRREWTRSRGKAFPSPEPEQVISTAEQHSLFERSSVAPEQSPLPSPRFDDGWTPGDRDLFNQWALRLPAGVEAEEEYRRSYGDKPPSYAWTV